MVFVELIYNEHLLKLEINSYFNKCIFELYIEFNNKVISTEKIFKDCVISICAMDKI